MGMDSEYLYKEDLREHPPIPERGMVSQVVQNTDHIRVIQFTFEEGHGLTAHQAPHPVTLTFLKGQARVQIGSDEVAASEGTFISMPANLEHAIHAESKVVMLLTMIK